MARFYFDTLFDEINGRIAANVKDYQTVDKDGNTVLTVDMPGVEKENIEITTENSILTVKGKRSDKDYNYDLSWRIASHIDLENVKAVLKNGVLSITLTKNPKATKKILIE